MNKKILTIFLVIFFFLTDATIGFAKKDNVILKKIAMENIKAIYISYLEYLNNFYGKSKTANQLEINKMVDIVHEQGYNTIILHVSPFSDSIYKSKLFPYSYTLTGTEGKNPGFDYLEYFIKRAHMHDIKIYAWINPYRISFDSNLKNISDKNPAFNLLNTSSVYMDKKGIYYNPASNIVKELITNQVKEIIDNYDVDGIHFDDYFYVQDKIDNNEYELFKKSDNNISLKQFRLNNTNDLIKRVYKIIKQKNANIKFSIAPDGNINNNYLYHFADVKTWLKSSDYIDIIMPQIYYGFENEYSPFEKVLNDWISLCENKNIQIVPVLAYYKLGKIDKEAGGGKNEWLNDNIIARQIEMIEEKKLSGFGIFRYDFIVNK